MSRGGKSRGSTELLLYADSVGNADMLYFGGVFVPDPFMAFTCGKKRLAVVSQLEFSRVLKGSRFDEVLSLEKLTQQAGKGSGSTASIVLYLAREKGIRKFRIAEDFPAGLAFQLRKAGIKLEVSEGSLFPEREKKSQEEARFIREGNRAAAAGFKVVERLLRQAEIRKRFLVYKGKRLTSEFLQKEIAIACLNFGAEASNAIVAGGDQACDPHNRGSGPLKANELIIVDIFPRVLRTGYYGDMTRTYLKGQPTDSQESLYQTVYTVQQEILGRHRAGKSAGKLYQEVQDMFRKKGYRTERINSIPAGFIHGLGHGLGLAVHESPRVNASGSRLKKNQVVTVEPGLYYPGLGGVRVEDVVRIADKQPELLSDHGYRWRIS